MLAMKKSRILIPLLFLLAFLRPSPLASQSSPHYQVDPSWPKQLPNNWILGHVQHVFVDQDDHIWLVHTPELVQPDEAGLAQKTPISECCIPAPAILEFDTEGNLLSSWDGPGKAPNYPMGTQAVWLDDHKNFWMIGAGRRPGMHVPREGAKNNPWGGGNVMKFAAGKEAQLLLEIGHNPKITGEANNQDIGVFGFPSSIQVDETAHEVYIADGFINRRIVVYDSNTGKFKRGWGAYGIPLEEITNSTLEDDPTLGRPVNHGQDYDPSAPPSKQFRGPLKGLRISNDNLVYIGDGENDRIQVFTKEGKFVKEFFVAPKTLDEGAVMDIAFSRDAEQKYLYVADGSNNVIWILNRKDGSVVSSFGHRGHNAGQFSYLLAIGVDSHGSVYTGEVKYTNRSQKFVLR